MQTSNREKQTLITKLLSGSAPEFDFVQAIRLLERCYAHENNTPINTDSITPPENEAIRFHGNFKFDFLSGDINSIYKETKNLATQKWHIDVNFFCLSGSTGVLPHHYSELILQRQKIKDYALSSFLDLFNHRQISLYYNAAIKYNLAIQYERQRLNRHKIEKDPITSALLSLIGLGGNSLQNKLHINDESLLYYSGLFSQNIKSIKCLKTIIRRHFSMNVEINDFIGNWEPIVEDFQTRLTSSEMIKGQNACLGKDTILGTKSWYAQGKVQIIIFPENQNELQKFSPGSAAVKALSELICFYAGLEVKYEIILRINRTVIFNNLKISNEQPLILGWNTWLIPENNPNKTESTIDISVPAESFH